jgi:hypothetical protein
MIKNKDIKLTIFLLCVVMGFLLQVPLGSHCRCHWGSWSSRFIEGALALDLFLIVHTVMAIRKQRFYSDCLITASLWITSFLWIPLVYRGVTALYLLLSEKNISALGH